MILCLIYSFDIFDCINRLELHTESSNTKPELIFMDQIEEVSPEFVQYKNEQCIQIRFRDGIRDGRAVLTNAVRLLINILCCSSALIPNTIPTSTKVHFISNIFYIFIYFFNFLDFRWNLFAIAICLIYTYIVFIPFRCRCCFFCSFFSIFFFPFLCARVCTY